MADRFKRIYKQGMVTAIEIWVDTQTGVNYIWRESGYAGGMTVLLDRDGKPVITRDDSVGFRVEE